MKAWDILVRWEHRVRQVWIMEMGTFLDEHDTFEISRTIRVVSYVQAFRASLPHIEGEGLPDPHRELLVDVLPINARNAIPIANMAPSMIAFLQRNRESNPARADWVHLIRSLARRSVSHAESVSLARNVARRKSGLETTQEEINDL
jgi:hypothetical protein